MVNLQADASLSVAAAGLSPGLPYTLSFQLDSAAQDLNSIGKNIGNVWYADANLDVTTAITADFTRNQFADSSLSVTASLTAAVTRNQFVDSATQAITVTLLRDFLRNVNVDSATQAITVGKTGTDIVTFDSVGVGATGSGTPKTITWNHTISPSANYVIMAVSVLVNGTLNPGILTALLGSTPMTYLGGADNYDTSPGPYALYFWGMANPPTGTQTFSVGTSSLATYLAANTVAYRNVGETAPIYTVNGPAETSFSQGPINAESNQLVVQAFAQGQNVAITGYNKTQRYSVSGVGNVNASLLIGDAAGGSPLTFTATSSASDYYGAVALALIAAPSGLRNAVVDSSQSTTATLTPASTRNAIVNASQALSAVPVSYPIANFKVSSSGVITANTTGVGSYGAVGNTSLALTSTETGTGSYGAVGNSSLAITHFVLSPRPLPVLAASANASQIITVGDSEVLKWAAKFDAPLALTATAPALENESAVAATPLPLTASLTATASKTRAVDSSTQIITATLTADMIRNAGADSQAGVVFTITSAADRNAIVDGPQAITVTETSVLKWAARVDLSESITATTSTTATRAARVDALLAITADPSATPHIDHPANAPLVVTATDTAGVSADFVVGASMLVSTSSSATALRSIFFDAELVITETATSRVKWALKAQASQVITVDSSGTATRNARVNASLQASLGQDDYMFQTESFDVPLNVIADLTAILNVATTLDSPTLDVVADLTGRVYRLLFADSDLIDIPVEIPPPDSLLSHFAEALVAVDNALDGSVVLDAICNVPLEVSADASVVINQDAFIDTDLEIEAIFVSNVVMDALLDAYLDANANLPAEGIRGQYVDAEQELTFTVTEEIKWHIVMQALLNVPVTTIVDTRSGQATSNFFVFYL